MMKILISICLLTLASTESSAQEEDPAGRTYQETCVVCHGEGVGGAPRLGIAEDWTRRLEYGIEDVYYNTIDGLGGMPPRGTCMNCSDDQLKAVVDFMLGRLE